LQERTETSRTIGVNAEDANITEKVVHVVAVQPVKIMQTLMAAGTTVNTTQEGQPMVTATEAKKEEKMTNVGTTGVADQEVARRAVRVENKTVETATDTDVKITAEVMKTTVEAGTSTVVDEVGTKATATMETTSITT
jgi:hypothetical protein